MGAASFTGISFGNPPGSNTGLRPSGALDRTRSPSRFGQKHLSRANPLSYPGSSWPTLLESSQDRIRRRTRCHRATFRRRATIRHRATFRHRPPRRRPIRPRRRLLPFPHRSQSSRRARRARPVLPRQQPGRPQLWAPTPRRRRCSRPLASSHCLRGLANQPPPTTRHRMTKLHSPTSRSLRAAPRPCRRREAMAAGSDRTRRRSRPEIAPLRGMRADAQQETGEAGFRCGVWGERRRAPHRD